MTDPSGGSFAQRWLSARSSCGQLAAEAAYLRFLKPAARQDFTLRSRPPSGSVWASVCVNVLGGAYRRAGNAPRYHNSKSASYITAPSSASTDLDPSSPPFKRGFASFFFCLFLLFFRPAPGPEGRRNGSPEVWETSH